MISHSHASQQKDMFAVNLKKQNLPKTAGEANKPLLIFPLPSSIHLLCELEVDSKLEIHLVFRVKVPFRTISLERQTVLLVFKIQTSIFEISSSAFSSFASVSIFPVAHIF